MSDLPLIGRGRAADVFDAGNGRVLRRYRSARADSVEREALAMRHLREHGAPVPEVFSAAGTDIVMERLEGPTMLDVLKTRPWRAASIGRELAALHVRVHSIVAGDIDLPRFGDGEAILHLDLHPDNVIITADGPMIIDWSNVAVGDPLADVMNTWMLMVTSSPDSVPLVLRPVTRRIRRCLPTVSSRPRRSTTTLVGGSDACAISDFSMQTLVTTRRRGCALSPPTTPPHRRTETTARIVRGANSRPGGLRC